MARPARWLLAGGALALRGVGMALSAMALIVVAALCVTAASNLFQHLATPSATPRPTWTVPTTRPASPAAMHLQQAQAQNHRLLSAALHAGALSDGLETP